MEILTVAQLLEVMKRGIQRLLAEANGDQKTANLLDKVAEQELAQQVIDELDESFEEKRRLARKWRTLAEVDPLVIEERRMAQAWYAGEIMDYDYSRGLSENTLLDGGKE